MRKQHPAHLLKRGRIARDERASTSPSLNKSALFSVGSLWHEGSLACVTHHRYAALVRSIILGAATTDSVVSNDVYLVLTVTYRCKIIKRNRHEKEKSGINSLNFLSGIVILTYKPASTILKEIDTPSLSGVRVPTAMPDSLITNMDRW
jgi:hypothetical protein